MNQKPDPKPHVDEAELKSFVSALPFVQEFSITITSVVPGQVTIELPFDERFSGPPGQFPASIVGVAGDVAAVASCLSLLPNGWALATLDFTIKMTGAAKGNKLRAKGRVLVVDCDVTSAGEALPLPSERRTAMAFSSIRR
jgi:acyl-coenzyme A thioesterase PaaI-like protein